MFWLLMLISYISLRCGEWEIALLAGAIPVVFTVGALVFSAYDHLVNPQNKTCP